MIREYGGTGAELVPGTLRGYREWQGVSGGLLASLSMAYIWEGVEVAADCLKSTRHNYRITNGGSPGGLDVVRDTVKIRADSGHVVPDRGCTCGVYAKHHPIRTGGGYIQGVIEAWGRVELGSEGFRSEQAKIVALAMPQIIFPEEFAEFMRILGARYKGVRFFPTADRMYDEYPPIDVAELLPQPDTIDEEFKRLWQSHWK